VSAGGCSPTGVGEDNCIVRGDDAQDGQWQGTRRRRWSPGGRGGRRRVGGRRGGGRAPEAGEDGAEEEDGAAAAEPQEAGAGRGGSRARVPGADSGGPVAWQGARALVDFGCPAAAENPVGQRTGGAAEGCGRGG
jgi:hypothetical protein